MSSPPANGSRTRRKVSRINYAEDAIYEEMAAVSTTAASVATASKSSSKSSANSSSASTPKGTKRSHTNASSNGDITASNGTSKKDKDKHLTTPASVVDKFPMNWQRKIPANEKLSSRFDYDGAAVKPDGKLYLRDGTILAPEGK